VRWTQVDLHLAQLGQHHTDVRTSALLRSRDRVLLLEPETGYFQGRMVTRQKPLFVLSGPDSAAFHEVTVERLFLASARLGTTVVLK